MKIPISKDDALLVASHDGIFLYPSFQLSKNQTMSYRRLASGASLEVHKDPKDKRRRNFFLVSCQMNNWDLNNYLGLIGMQDLIEY